MSLPELDPLVSRLKAIKPSRLTRIGYRSVTPKYASQEDVLTGEGSRIHGARWNPPGIATVYASFTPETAMAESLAHFRYYGIAPPAAMPRVFVAVEARFSKVLDLTEGGCRFLSVVYSSAIGERTWQAEPRP